MNDQDFLKLAREDFAHQETLALSVSFGKARSDWLKTDHFPNCLAAIDCLTGARTGWHRRALHLDS